MLLYNQIEQKKIFVKCIIYLLLHWDEAIVFPSYSTFLNGDPEANMARPFVHLCAASAVHSALDVGLDNGIITGGVSWPSFIVVKTSSKTELRQVWVEKIIWFQCVITLIKAMISNVIPENSPPHVERPIRMFGFTAFTTSSRPIPIKIFRHYFYYWALYLITFLFLPICTSVLVFTCLPWRRHLQQMY